MQDAEYIQFHRFGRPCYIRADKISYVGPMTAATTSYTVVDGAVIIIDEDVETVMSLVAPDED